MNQPPAQSGGFRSVSPEPGLESCAPFDKLFARDISLSNYSSATASDPRTMISHAYRCVFVRQLKCASTSIIQAFGVPWETPDGKRFSNGVLSPRWLERKELYGDYFSFAVVRNPWDRFVSGWRYLESTRDRPLID